jgi:hypothetical protein
MLALCVTRNSTQPPLQRGKSKHAWIGVGYHAQQRGTLLSNPLPKDSLIKGRLLSPLTNVR